MEKSNKRGKIPQADWPLIMARYEAGETLASIARTYDCSPPAISYVVSKSRNRQSSHDGGSAGAGEPEAGLVKGRAAEPAISEASRRMRPGAPTVSGVERRAETMITGSDIATASPRNPASHQPAPGRPPRDSGGTARDRAAERTPHHPPAATQVSGSGNARPGPVAAGPRPVSATTMRGEIDPRHRLPLSPGNTATSYNNSADDLFPPPMRPAGELTRSASPPNRSVTGSAEVGLPRPPRRDDPEADPEAPTRKDGVSAFIDQELRDRVDTDITAFLAAFDAALVADTKENRSALREATNRLLRAGARTCIELERLEARVPLSASGHDRGGDPGTWRPR
jgi:hypothetical protein